MSEAVVPSYRVPREQGSGAAARLLLIAGGVLGVVAVGGAIAWGIGRMGGIGAPRGVPVVEADPRPMKIRPESPGGLVVPNTDQMVLEPLAVRRAAERQQGANAQLAPQSEAPQLDLLRRAAAPPAPTPIPGVEGLRDTPVPRPGATPSSLGTRTAALPAPVPPPPAGAPGVSPPQAGASGVSPPQAGASGVSPPQAGAPALSPAAPAAPVPAAPGRVQVQLGALATEEAAKAEWSRLQRRVPALAGRQPVITRLDRGAEQPPLFRLRTGGIADAVAGRELCEAVRAAGGACSLVPGAATPPARGA